MQKGKLYTEGGEGREGGIGGEERGGEGRGEEVGGKGRESGSGKREMAGERVTAKDSF